MQKSHGLGFSRASQAAAGQSAGHLMLRGCGMSVSRIVDQKCLFIKGLNKEVEVCRPHSPHLCKLQEQMPVMQELAGTLLCCLFL